MPKSENQKQKLLYLLKFFYEETDEEHTLTVNQMIDKLEQNGISAARFRNRYCYAKEQDLRILFRFKTF